ncbi:putative phenylacetone monooxygenase protein [Phaeoacremonium minimum UCRPA7]|uniref:Putative phenylacetone monooxygenase protein n=1 Tax=Phaeoacremonium minimum (strain UCR-PA7) TaxID=1286976 RepID=R8BNB0_PHAM7|nr:putative phenylacetone monooxygenase protein [Phaeoacremonium minimum UCRPA7]EOO00829.1 putative phenylacetone monooxygenase protein [Phaeoacremonium minimum UCRPA7]
MAIGSGNETIANGHSAFGTLNDELDYDVLIIGAGLSGIYSMHRVRELGMKAKVLEAGSSVGGTWFWNRYPGARFDSESYSYIFSFSPEILKEWNWTEHFSPQTETLKYIEYITDKLDTIASSVGQLTVFQRTPNWTAPLRNQVISPEEMETIRKQYPEIFRLCLESYSCFIHRGETRGTFEMTPEERLAHWEELYAKPGFAKVLGISADIYTDRKANELYSEFNANKIRARVKDPKTAEKLIPRNHGFGTRRVPLESGYFEVYNQPNVELVDINENPIQRVTETGIKTQDKDYELDILIYATGFDAVTGSFNAVDIEGIDGIKLRDVWSEGIRTFLGLTVKGFPNFFMVMGPHQMFGNIPRSIEYAVDWVADFLRYAAQHKLTEHFRKQ